MSGNFEGGHDGLTSTFQRKFLEIKFRGFLQIADGFRDCLALGGSAGFRIDGNKAAFFGRNEYSGKKHGNTVGAVMKRVKQIAGLRW